MEVLYVPRALARGNYYVCLGNMQLAKDIRIFKGLRFGGPSLIRLVKLNYFYLYIFGNAAELVRVSYLDFPKS